VKHKCPAWITSVGTMGAVSMIPWLLDVTVLLVGEETSVKQVCGCILGPPKCNII
jgi:hypothetical protein